MHVVSCATHLVLDFALDSRNFDCFGEGGAVLVKLDTLGPVVEGAGYVDFFGGMVPIWQQQLAGESRNMFDV